MAALGLIAGGTLLAKVLVDAVTVAEMMNYTIVAIAICACCTALLALSTRVSRPAGWISATRSRSEAAALRLMAAQTPFAESRLRLLVLAERMERRGS